MSWRLGSRSVLLVALAALLALALPAHADGFDQALAEVEQALETNPMGVSQDNIETCRAMLKTAVLLKKMGKVDRAVRRIKGCRRLLGFDESHAGRIEKPGARWV